METKKILAHSVEVEINKFQKEQREEKKNNWMQQHMHKLPKTEYKTETDVQIFTAVKRTN